MNIILCIIDTLRYDYIRAYGVHPWLKTPNFDRLAAESVMFDRAFAASYPTIPHRTDVMTGEYAWEGRGPFHPWMPLRFDTPTIPRLLAQAGYATQLIHDTPHLVNGGHAFDWPFAAWSFVRGAEVDRPWIDEAGLDYLSNWAPDPLFDFADNIGPSAAIKRLLLTYSRANRNRQQLSDWNTAKLFSKAVEFITANTERDNLFLWLDCFDPHEPWDSPAEFVKLYDHTPGYDGRIDPRAFYPASRKGVDNEFPPGVRERQLALYAAKVSWVDHWFGVLLDTLETTGMAKNTAIILTADHGTNLGERGGYGKTSIVNEQEAHVPLLLRVPGVKSYRDGRFVQPQDIFTTILSIAGIEPSGNAVGLDLTQPSQSDRKFALGGVSTDSWKGDPKQILFTIFGDTHYLNITADPAKCRLFTYGSVDDVAADNADVVRYMREQAWEMLKQRETDPELIDWLSSGGTASFSDTWSMWPGPPQWRRYWERVYME
jgi:arylsulfatase A-like enzyme